LPSEVSVICVELHALLVLAEKVLAVVVGAVVCDLVAGRILPQLEKGSLKL
jgi:hypothetical protein